MVKQPDIKDLIWMYRHYMRQAERCWGSYEDLIDAYFMFDYYMEMASIYENAILSHI